MSPRHGVTFELTLGESLAITGRSSCGKSTTLGLVGESMVVAVCGPVAGGIIGTDTASLLMHVLRPLFTLPPGSTPAVRDVVLLDRLAVVATLVTALAATAMLRRLKPTGLLREE